MANLSEREGSLVDELRNCRTVISELLDKTWEFGGQYVGEQEYESYSFVKDAREQLKAIDDKLWELQ